MFSAYKEGDPEQKAIHAIKDNWLEAGHALEFDVYNDIIKAVHEHDWSQYTAPPEHPDDLDETRWQQPELKSPIDPRHGEVGLDRTSFFVPILAGLRVAVEDGRDDDTVEVMLGGYQIPLACPTLCVSSDGSQAQRKVRARTHHRTVMRLGTPLDKIRTASRAFGSLADAAYGMTDYRATKSCANLSCRAFVLHQVGYCHHDMSPFNILELNEQGVLADFEYVSHSSQLQARRGARMVRFIGRTTAACA